MWKSVSNTAEYGGRTRGPRIITPATKEKMKEILEDIKSGKFANEWINENKVGCPVLNALRDKGKEHLIEEVGGKLRKMMNI
jgi:ketol-acid reductoisomerase